MKHIIIYSFNFAKEVYGCLPEEEIRADLRAIFFILAKRYKKMGRNFCAYLYNSFCYEVFRLIKRCIKDPANIGYRRTEMDDTMLIYEEIAIEEGFEDHIYEDNMGIPDFSWICGDTCSEPFSALEPLERKILIKYFLEDYSDKQIAESLGITLSLCNQKRRDATGKIADALGVDRKKIKRYRKVERRDPLLPSREESPLPNNIRIHTP